MSKAHKRKDAAENESITLDDLRQIYTLLTLYLVDKLRASKLQLHYTLIRWNYI